MTSWACSRRASRPRAVDGIACPRPCRSSSATRGAREALRAAPAARPRPRGQDRDPDPLRRPARGRPRPDRKCGRSGERYGAPCIVVDFGTSTNFDVVSAEGEYVGGVLAPGSRSRWTRSSQRAARLFKVDFVEPPSVIGQEHGGRLQSGLVYGFAGQVDGIVERIRGELGAEAPAVATGGLADLIAPHAAHARPRRPVPDARGAAARVGAKP